MKKLLCSVMATVIFVCMSASVMAASSSVSIKNNVAGSKPVTYTYDSDKSGEIVKSIKSLMTKLSDLPKQDSVVQTLTISSETAGTAPVSFKLRLSVPDNASSTAKPEAVKTPSPEQYSALEYYNIQITDTKGNVIYSYEEDEKNEQQKTYKDIPLGVLNSSSRSENKIFNITLSINKDLKKSSIAKNAEKLDWSIVSDTYIDVPAQTAAPQITVTADPDPQPTDKQQSSVKEDKNGVITLAKGEYLCGSDIEPGRYTMTGDGKVHVYTSEGVIKTTIALKDKDDTSSKGVDEYLINLLEGEKVAVESDTQFTPYTAAKATSSPKPTSSPKVSASPKTASKTSATATPKAAAANNKNNPKTGDSAPIVGVSALGIIALGAFAFITIKKRKEN
ncbi:MAG: LPXTG cell wall anchor domain-containing protein [Clostridia bacterium]|nr:LPXTG cell wall anchor domain-containing protein [Clostridia bacterium]